MDVGPAHRLIPWCSALLVLIRGKPATNEPLKQEYIATGCFGFMFMCTPISALCDKTITNASCMNGKVVYFTSAAFNILTDFILFGLPLPILSQLQLPRRQKWLLIMLFGIGLMYVFPFRTNSYRWLLTSNQRLHDKHWPTQKPILPSHIHRLHL
jgi:hypothetical protein